jgi:hypothetical protein
MVRKRLGLSLNQHKTASIQVPLKRLPRNFRLCHEPGGMEASQALSGGAYAMVRMKAFFRKHQQAR